MTQLLFSFFDNGGGISAKAEKRNFRRHKDFLPQPARGDGSVYLYKVTAHPIYEVQPGAPFMARTDAVAAAGRRRPGQDPAQAPVPHLLGMMPRTGGAWFVADLCMYISREELTTTSIEPRLRAALAGGVPIR